ncbi:twin-arginine translocation signal domain-containing protein [Crenobacter cavernae]|uniref:Twin-arginine translocation signal domain-containing protein n=1 Tax=Crenobacter cavernae TaxID=2290923 RepID=A0A345Y4G7_9NEIS|nr:hypothetical protein DWG20_04890 [Crenobacter cavernae]
MSRFNRRDFLKTAGGALAVSSGMATGDARGPAELCQPARRRQAGRWADAACAARTRGRTRLRSGQQRAFEPAARRPAASRAAGAQRQLTRCP